MQIPAEAIFILPIAIMVGGTLYLISRKKRDK